MKRSCQEGLHTLKGQNLHPTQANLSVNAGEPEVSIATLTGNNAENRVKLWNLR